MIYVAVQQSYRSGANDPQLQLARDIAIALKNNQAVDQLLPKDKIDISESLAPFVVFYDNNGEPVRSTAILNGQIPKIPKGVFDFSKTNQEDVLTWQPRYGVRMALVVEYVQSSGVAFVAAGRSLQEVEKREGNLKNIVVIGWLACIAVIVFHWLIGGINKRQKPHGS